MGLCKIPISNDTITFAGANMDLIQIDAQGSYLKHRGSIKSIGGIYRPNSKRAKMTFTNIEIAKSGRFFMATDGIVDQFGGPSDTKFGIEEFKKLLLGNQEQPLDTVEHAIQYTISEWKGNKDQIDDMLVIGFQS